MTHTLAEVFTPSARETARLRRIAPRDPAPIEQSLVLTGAKLKDRRIAIGLSRGQLGALALVDSLRIRRAELDGQRLSVGEQIRLEYLLRAVEAAAAEARAATGLSPLVLPEQAS